ncbi:MAG: Asd/ArgC dimerization domain-containing protein [Myxococcales bacterium]
MLAAHPRFEVAAALSTSQPGAPVVEAFPHLAGTSLDRLKFEGLGALDRLLSPERPLGLFAATPHGATAPLLDDALSRAETRGAAIHAVDLSADFRFPDPAQYERVYQKPHPAPKRLASFASALPELWIGPATAHAAQPGCFVTAVTLGAHAFFALGLVEDEVFASAITGSSGSGRTPAAGTHHPERHDNLWAYSPLSHRHEAEMRRLLGLARGGGGAEPEVLFVPHSGPFVRGIHATLHLKLKAPASADVLVEQAGRVFAACPFVKVSLAPPKLSEVVGTNRCRLGVAVRGKDLVVTSVIDNLVKGAAGGGVQWMNRLFGLDQAAGLTMGGLGWL